MKLQSHLSAARGRGFHSAFATTFAIEFEAFEQIMLPQFQASGATNIVLLADRAMVTEAFAGGSAPPRRAGRDYLLASSHQAQGVFHPKVFLQLGRDAGRLIVGSANVTGSGLAGNLEAVCAVECTREPGPERSIISAAWRWLRQLDVGGPRTAEAFAWAEQRAPWLETDSAPEDVASLDDGSQIAFLTGGSEGSSLMGRFIDLVGADAIRSLTVVSPYWDDELGAVEELAQRLGAETVRLLFQPAEMRFPVHAPTATHFECYDVAALMPKVKRFLHAKLLIASSDTHDHVLVGSANCTRAALGSVAFRGVNAEACLYRRAPSGSVVERLGLDRVLERPTLSIEDIPAKVDDVEPPAESRTLPVGEFETEYTVLHWAPSLGTGLSNARVELLDDPGSDPLATLNPHDWLADGGRLRLNIGALATRLHFARVIVGDRSGLGVVVRADEIHNRRREPASRDHRNVMRQLAAGSEIDLDQLDLLSLLERLDHEEAEEAARRPRKPGARAEKPEAPVRKLSYEDFVRTRGETPTGRGEFARNSLAGTNADLMRDWLDRIVGGGVAELPVAGPGSNPFGPSDDEEEPDPDGNGVDPPGTPPDDPTPEQRRPLDPVRVEKAVDKFQTLMRQRVDAGAVTGSDVLRLRLLLTYLLDRAGPAYPDASAELKRDRLAPDGSDQGWPRLIMRTLVAFFHGPNAPITRLAVDEAFDALPDDYLRAWGTSLWALWACREAIEFNPAWGVMLKHLAILDAVVTTRMALRSEELNGELIAEMRAVLDRRYRDRIFGPQQTLEGAISGR